MKFIGNIVCIIAILTQIILSAGLLSHAPECSAEAPLSPSETNLSSTTTRLQSQPQSPGCACNHHGHHHTAKVTKNISEKTYLHQHPPVSPAHDCSCTPQKTHPYTLSNQIITHKSSAFPLNKNHSSSSHIHSSHPPLRFSKSNQSNAPPPLQQDHLPKHHCRFASIHLGIFHI